MDLDEWFFLGEVIILGGVIIIIVCSTLLTSIYVYHSNEIKSFCLSNDFNKGYLVDGNIYIDENNIFKCYNDCFNSSVGGFDCNVTYFREVVFYD